MATALSDERGLAGAVTVDDHAMDHLVRWVSHDIAPPTAPDIELLTITPDSAVMARDNFGNALGGIRLSQHAVPTATNTGLNSGPGFCRLFGWFQPFDAATLDAQSQAVTGPGTRTMSLRAPAPAGAYLRFLGRGSNLEVSYDGGRGRWYFRWAVQGERRPGCGATKAAGIDLGVRVLASVSVEGSEVATHFSGRELLRAPDRPAPA